MTTSSGVPLTYAVGSNDPELVADFAGVNNSGAEYYRASEVDTDFPTLFSGFSRTGSAYYFNDAGVLTEATSGNARRNSHIWNGSEWVNAGIQYETSGATQLLHGTDSFATQTESVSAQAYTLQFRGTGSITLSGAHSATLNGTGANDLVTLTFTPSAGTLTLTPSGTVEYPQLEVGSTASSYIPNTAGSGTVTRAAESGLDIAGADTPANTTGISIQIEGYLTYADTNTASQAILLRWLDNSNNYIIWYLATNAGTGTPYILQRTAAVSDFVLGGGSEISAGVNSAFNIAARHGDTFVNAAAGGTAFTENSTPVALADLSSTTLQLGQTFNGHIAQFRMWGTDIGDSGIEAASASS